MQEIATYLDELSVWAEPLMQVVATLWIRARCPPMSAIFPANSCRFLEGVPLSLKLKLAKMSLR